MSTQRKYQQNGGMFFSLNGGPIQEYENSEFDDIFDLFKTIIGTATSIRLLSEFSLYGFVFEVSIPPDGPVKIMRQTRSNLGHPLTPKRASKRQDPSQFEQMNSFCLKVVGLKSTDPLVRSKPYTSLDGKHKNKSLARFDECRTELEVTRRVWGEMTRYSCAEIVPDAGFGFHVSHEEFGKLFDRFMVTSPLSTPRSVSSLFTLSKASSSKKASSPKKAASSKASKMPYSTDVQDLPSRDLFNMFDLQLALPSSKSSKSSKSPKSPKSKSSSSSSSSSDLPFAADWISPSSSSSSSSSSTAFAVPLNSVSYVIQWIIRNFDTCYLTVMEMANGCDTFSGYIGRMGTGDQVISERSIKNVAVEIIGYLMSMWIRTGIMTTDGHSKNVMVNATQTNPSEIHVSFDIYLLDMGRIFDRTVQASAIVEHHFRRLFSSGELATGPRQSLRFPLLAYLGCHQRPSLLLQSSNDDAIDELRAKFIAELDFVTSLQPASLTSTGLDNIVDLKRAFKAAVACDIIVNASNYDHDYMQCATVLERAFGRRFTNVSFLSDPFNSPEDNVVFTRILSTVNRLLIPCHPGEDLPSLRTMSPPLPLIPRAYVKSRNSAHVEKGAVVVGADAEVPDDSSSSGDRHPGELKFWDFLVDKKDDKKKGGSLKRSQLRKSRTKKRRIRTTRCK